MESDKPKTLGQRLRELWLGSLHFFGLMPVKHHDEGMATLRKIYEAEITQYDQINADLRTLAAKYRETIDTLEDSVREKDSRLNSQQVKLASQAQLIDTATRNNEQLLKEKLAVEEQLRQAMELADRYKQAPDDNKRFVKDTLKELNAMISSADEFGFYKAKPYPGSTAIESNSIVDPDTGNRYVEVCGRTIALDDTTALINREPDLYGKLQLLLNQMVKLGTLSKMVERLILGGAVGMELSYNKDNTNYMVNWTIRSLVPNTQYTFKENGAFVPAADGSEASSADAES